MLKERIEQVLREEVRPFLSMHGGDVELTELIEDMSVKVRLSGACCGCPSAQVTLRYIVENAIKSKVPEFKGVEIV